VENDLLTNKKNSALLRDTELEIARRGEAPVPLHSIAKDHWDRYLDRDVTLPPNVAHYLHGRATPLSKEEVQSIEIATEKFHGVTKPYYVAMSLTLQKKGRAWGYIPEADEFLTGLTLGKI
jgi:hypothetical protein